MAATFSENDLINNRPEILLKKEYYTELPAIPTEFNYGSLPTYLNMDLYTFVGIIPKTLDLIRNTHPGFSPTPSEQEIEYYKKKKTRFQVINVVANIHTFKKTSETLASAFPYSISLIAGPRRGKPDQCSIEFLRNLGDLDSEALRSQIYTDFSPFKPVEQGLYAHSSFLTSPGLRHYTDTVGFVLETYFLPMDVDLEDVAMAGPQNLDKATNDKFRKYRIKRYFKPFEDIKPRRIWGCDSPIELFLIQALAMRDLFPVIQTLIFKNGMIFDNFYDMIKDKIFIKGDELITEVDLFFPDQRLAVFCDSHKYHRQGKSKNKDQNIDLQLAGLGISTLRISGKQIVDRLEETIDLVCKRLNL